MRRALLLLQAAMVCLILLSWPTHTLLAQPTTQSISSTIKGTISDDKGAPVAGATIQVKGGKTTTISRQDGTYEISVPNTNATLVITAVNYNLQEVALQGRSSVDVSLAQAASKSLDEVVVIGYGTARKRNVTSAISTFNASNLDERPVTRVDQALVGQMAGVNVRQTTGALGKGLSVQVRGTSSISAGSEPLYVIDGFPLAQAAPNGSGNYANGNPLDNINPNDIESIQVLKDAAAAAIYGSRAGNGVVLVTTKRGKTGKAKLNLNSTVGFTERSRKLDMLNADEFIDRAKEIINAQWVASSTGRTATQTNEQRRVILGLAPGVVNTSYMTDDRWDLPGHPGLRYIDWQDEGFRKGLVQNHQLSASGGNEFVRYYVSGNFLRQEGMVINTDYTAYSARANVEVTPNKRLKFGLNINPTYSINNDPGVEGKDNILHQMVSFTPVQEDTMGLYPNVGKNGQYRWSVSPNSPIGKLQNTLGRTSRFRTLTTVFGEVQIIDGLTFRTTVNFDNSDNDSKGYTPFLIAGTQASRTAQGTILASGSYSGVRKQTLVNENTLNYAHTFGTAHDVSLLAGYSYNMDHIYNERIASNGGYAVNGIYTLNQANAVTGNTTETKNILLSYFGRFQYGYEGKYLVSASIRRDGASRFGANNRWGIFPSASVGWRVSQESFMKDITWLSELKLRYSYGKAGNYNIPDYAAFATLGPNNYSFNGASAGGQAPSSIANPDITWEKSSTNDVGFDFGILKNRIIGSFDYYNRLTSDLLLYVPTLAVTGFNQVLGNAGKLRNKGWELELSSRNITTRKFQWTTNGNISHNSNKVEELFGGQSQILIPSSFDIPHSILRIGDPLYSIYVVKQIGILSQDDINKRVAVFGSEAAGDPKYFDADGNGVIDANDRVIVGKPNPSYNWGITNTIKYGDFDLSVLIQGQWGGSIYSLLGRALGRTGQGFTDNALGTYRDRWRSEANPGAGVVSKAYSTFGRIVNTDWLYSSDYYRIRFVTLGYNLGKVLPAKYVSNARIYVSAENFLGHDKYKGGFNPEANNTNLSGSDTYPEAGDYGGLPLPRSLILGLNVTF